MATVISLKGIDEAISDLNYRDNKTLKDRLVHAIRESYESKGAVTTLQGIDTDELVKALWDTGDDPSTIKTKRKNLSSIKSSVNADLKRLYADGKNPEGIIIGRSNVFVMSDEAKDRMLTSFTGSAKKDGGVTLEQINEVLNIVHEVLSDPEALANTGNSNRIGKLSQLKNIIQGLSQQIGLKVAHGDLTDEPATPSEVRAYGDTKDNENNPPSPPFTKGGNTLSPPLGEDGGPSIPPFPHSGVFAGTKKNGESQIPPLEKGDTGGFSDEIDMPPGHTKEEENVIAGSEAPHLSLRETTESRDDLDNSAQSQKDEIPCYGGKDKAGVSVTPGPGGGAYEPGRGQGITPEGALAAGISADTGGSEESTEEELEIVDQAELLEEADTEEVELDGPEEVEDHDEVEVVKDIEEKTPEEVEEVVEDDAEIVDEADLPEEAAPDEAEPIEEIEETEVEESLQEVEIVDDRAEAEAEEADLEEGLAEVGTGDDLEESEPAEDLEEITSEGSKKITEGEAAVVDEAELVEDEEPGEELPPEEMEEVEELAGDEEVQKTLTEVVDDQPEIEAEETESTEDLGPAEITDNLEEAEVVDEIAETKPEGEEVAQDDAEVADEAEIMEEAPEEELEPEEMGNIEDVEEDEVEEGIEELEITEKSGEPGLSAGGSEAGYSDGFFGEEDKIPRARLLAEEFNRLLGDRERFYNQYILIPAGDYIVGNKSPGKDERPEQKVHLETFYMGRFPVINALFEVFVEKTGYKTIAERLGYGKVYYGRFKKTVDEKTGSVRLICQSGLSCKTVYGACWHQPSGPESTIHNKRNHPVVQVSREDALAFAAWTGKRLPTEDEWEAATRTADGYVLPWGNDWQRDACNIEDRSIADTTPVDRYMDSGNNFGIIDAIGNVLEWTMEPCEPPSHAKHNVKYYVAKGGSWISGNDIRLFNRFRLEAEMHSNILGFRCVAY